MTTPAFLPIYVPNVVVQPTEVCNFNCGYCYLPNRRVKGTMNPAISAHIAASLQQTEGQTTIVWHGGEPLATGREKLAELFEPFEELRRADRIVHSVQTNASLINDAWCELFSHYGVRVGASIDGNREANARRVDWQGKDTFDATMRGIDVLKRNATPFTIIAVVSSANLDDPQAFYDFFCGLECRSLGINIEELEGLNADARVLETARVRRFWRGLWQAWLKDPRLEIREFSRAMNWARQENHASRILNPKRYNYWPTVSIRGDVVLTSPELAAAKPDDLKRFVVGNVLNEPLHEMLTRATDVWYVAEFFRGVEKCRETCPHYSYCGGGHSSNKFFETGAFDATETRQCQHHEQAVVETMLDEFEQQASVH